MKFFCISSVFHPKCVRNTKRSRNPFLLFFAFYGLRIAVILCPLLLLQKLTEDVITPVDGFVA